MLPAQEIALDTVRGRLAAQHWPAVDGPPVLCLHGWLDNSASFVPLAQHLSGFNLVALDFPGHGRSQHHSPRDHYYLADYLWDIDAALDALGWSGCHLLGHSMGAAVASLYACAGPERVRSLICLDGLGPITAPASGSAERLRRSLRSVRHGPRRKKVYASVDDMIAARQSRSDLSHAAARLICERSISEARPAPAPSAGGRTGTSFEWSNDPALYWVSPTLLTEEQVVDCLQGIQAPVLSLTARPFAPFIDQEKVRARAAAVAHGQHEFVTGGHHFHMEHPQRTAQRVGRFILEQAGQEGRAGAAVPSQSSSGAQHAPTPTGQK